MRVKATAAGEYPQGQWRAVGDVFDFDGDKPALWMEEVKGRSRKAKTKEPDPDPPADEAPIED